MQALTEDEKLTLGWSGVLCLHFSFSSTSALAQPSLIIKLLQCVMDINIMYSDTESQYYLTKFLQLLLAEWRAFVSQPHCGCH